ncbi:MAG: DUF368 domain-containing protein [Flavobacteriaceae bacterium]|nr:DUF368 domain-containing protein [Flavobacteriaceae bacterium]
MEFQKTRTLTNRVLLFIKGLAMGGANKIPGVSGGIVAFVTGFYEELIFSLKRINTIAFKLLFNGRFKSFFNYINGKFLLILFSGSLFSYFSVSLILDYFIKSHELYVWSLFFGLIIGSIYYIAKKFKDYNSKCILPIFIGVLFGIFISLLPPAKENSNLWFVFLCGIIGVSGMTLPGLSGSFILILLGNYVLLLVDSVNMLSKIFIAVFSGDFYFIQDQNSLKYLKIIGIFTVGSGFGLVVTSHILGFVLKRWRNIVTAVIIGFISGSLGNVWPWKEKVYKMLNNQFILDSDGNQILKNYKRYLPNLYNQETWVAITFIVFGIISLVIIEFYEKTIKK